MTILYIAGPMTGIPDYNYPAFNAAATRLKALGYETRNPVDSELDNPENEAKPWSWYMRRAIPLMLQADGVALLPNWEASRGAQLETHVAQAIGMACKPWQEWL